MTSSYFQRRSTQWLGAVLLVVLIGIIWLSVHKYLAGKQPAAQQQPILATTALVEQRDVPIYLTGVGSVAATYSVTVKPQVDGQLDKIDFVEGQDVKAGQLLAQIDSRTLQAQLAQVQAQKSRDAAQLANAKLDLQRYTTLQQQDAATQQTLDTQQALVAQLAAAVETDAAQINYAQVQLGFTRIAAPISGRVGARLIDAGNIVHANDATGLVVINQIDPISVVFTLPEESFQAINHALQNNRQPLAVAAYPRDSDTVLGTGKLTLLNNQIDTSTGTVQLKGTFANAANALWPGQYVNVHLVLGNRTGALTVPAAAVQRSQDGTYAYVVAADNTVKIQPLQVATIQDGIAIVDKGLVAGQRVVVDGQYKLKPGALIVEASAAQGASQ